MSNEVTAWFVLVGLAGSGKLNKNLVQLSWRHQSERTSYPALFGTSDLGGFLQPRKKQGQERSANGVGKQQAASGTSLANEYDEADTEICHPSGIGQA